eukprot:Rhum_TRINITY_DN13424_c2_g1::Rhum_TRINITY_DN13424_c2_g1_i1::g.59827::m.59827
MWSARTRVNAHVLHTHALHSLPPPPPPPQQSRARSQVRRDQAGHRRRILTGLFHPGSRHTRTPHEQHPRHVNPSQDGSVRERRVPSLAGQASLVLVLHFPGPREPAVRLHCRTRGEQRLRNRRLVVEHRVVQGGTPRGAVDRLRAHPCRKQPAEHCAPGGHGVRDGVAAAQVDGVRVAAEVHEQQSDALQAGVPALRTPHQQRRSEAVPGVQVDDARAAAVLPDADADAAAAPAAQQHPHRLHAPGARRRKHRRPPAPVRRVRGGAAPEEGCGGAARAGVGGDPERRTLEREVRVGAAEREEELGDVGTVGGGGALQRRHVDGARRGVRVHAGEQLQAYGAQLAGPARAAQHVDALGDAGAGERQRRVDGGGGGHGDGAEVADLEVPEGGGGVDEGGALEGEELLAAEQVERVLDVGLQAGDGAALGF